MEKNDSVSLSDPSLYINRELSWLEFNERVLEEVADAWNPLLERVKFLCIVASNLDEFFEIRVAGLKQQHVSNLSAPEPDALTPSEQLAAISVRVRKMVDDEYRLWNEALVPALEQNNVFFLHYEELT
ncbi:MAG: RNA degradosome polyphosphate kinase, partial [Verrucomicrobia bacterium]|nr:RNA degradosome polyphosphate kinase [Verrucomicrobiota bacterium]